MCVKSNTCYVKIRQKLYHCKVQMPINLHKPR